jgi:ABC-type antimicrobial peptide transport system permease subunit
MTLSDKASTAWSNLGRRKVRTALTSVGVVVGIMTVVTMISLVNGVQEQVNKQFEKIGLDRVTVRPATTGSFGSTEFNPFGFSERTKLITPAEVKRWRQWPEVKSALPELDMPGGIAAGITYKGSTQKVRVSSGTATRRGPFAEAPTALVGTMDLPEERGSIIVSRGIMRSFKVKQESFAALLGQPVEIVLATPRREKQNYRFKIIGVSTEYARIVHVPTTDRLAMKSWWFNNPKLLQNDGYDSVTLRAADVSQARTLVKRLRNEKFEVQSIDAILEVANRIFAVVTAMLACASSVALLVACIGIINTMIMSIYERTREIGTLKAMGASRSDIRQMFMIEAGLIGLMGGAVGLFMGWVVGRVLNQIAAWYARHRDLPLPENLFIITPSLALGSLLFALLIGIGAGLYPANRAARLDPLTALRHE